MQRQASGSASSTMGTLIRNTEPHQKCSSSTPPTTGPSAAPPDATDAQMPMATARSRSSAKVRRMMDRVAGIIMAAPTASSTRAAIKDAAPGE
ncbi:hypothetical protein D3C73_1185910 [compost metagenome]